jgi:hypothetical protein
MAQQQDIEALLPWHAAGTLSRRDARRVEEALAQDPELARRFALIRDELSETILLNETLGAPSGRAMDRLLASIDAEETPARRRKPLAAFATFMSERVARISPRTLGWSATAAALVIALQGGLLAGLYVHERGGPDTFDTASFDDGAESSRGIETSRGATRGIDTSRGVASPGGSYALIRFDPKAGMAEVSKFLESHHASVVDGPRAGMYRIRLADTPLPEDEVARIVKAMQDDTRIVRFVGSAN